MGSEINSWEERFIAWLDAHHRTDDAAHDLHHFRRVWRTACRLMQDEQADADELVILTAAYFHDFISLPKNHPESSLSSRFCAEKVGAMLPDAFPDFPQEKIPAVQHAIQAHSFSANITPLTIEARLLQDADRMEAIGAIGIARVFYTAGLLQKDMFHASDPLATQRPLNDKQYALDHFLQKLLKLPDLMQTRAGKAMAASRAAYLLDFMERITGEITGQI